MTPFDAFAELEPVAGRLLERHLATTKEWFPHELVPYSRGRDFVPGEQWSPRTTRSCRSTTPSVARCSSTC